MGGQAATRWSYELLPAHGIHGQGDPWGEVRAIIDREGPEDANWSIRAFSLDARFELALQSPNQLVWAGPLMDLACALHDWVRGDGSDLRFVPAEQAPTLTTRRRGANVDFYVGGELAGTLRLEDARASIEAFLAEFASDVRREAPKAIEVHGLGWLST